MLVSELGVLLDETSSHHQVTGDALGVLLLKRLQLVAGDAIEIRILDVIGDGRSIVVRTNRARVEGVAVLGLFPLTGGTVAAGRGTALGPETLLVRRTGTVGTTAALGLGATRRRTALTIARGTTLAVARRPALTVALRTCVAVAERATLAISLRTGLTRTERTTLTITRGSAVVAARGTCVAVSTGRTVAGRATLATRGSPGALRATGPVVTTGSTVV